MVSSKWDKINSNIVIKEKLQKLQGKNLDNQLNRRLEILSEVDESQLYSMLLNAGIRLKEDIILKYYNESIGFQCYNENEWKTGKTPLCQNIERFLNRK
jgi:hypothetical protein